MTTELMVRPSTTVPLGEWNLMNAQAESLARSDIIPKAYQRRPANVLVAAITGRHYGWDVLTAMRNGHVIEGAWGMKPEAMLGLVRQAGHSVKGTMLPLGATVTGTRSDTGDTMTIEFTLDDAVRAGLVQIKNGQPHSRSRSGQPLPWEQYPGVMCYWRAVGLLCRVLFSDITAGVYTAEELGAPISADGEVIDIGEIDRTDDEPMPLSDENLATFRQACEQIGVEPAVVLHAAFGPDVPDPLTDVHLPAMRTAYRFMVEEQAKEGTADAETVDGEQTAGSEERPEVRPASRAKVGKIKGEYARLGIEDRGEQLLETAGIIGRLISSHNDLDDDEASRVIDELTNRELDGERERAEGQAS